MPAVVPVLFPELQVIISNPKVLLTPPPPREIPPPLLFRIRHSFEPSGTSPHACAKGRHLNKRRTSVGRYEATDVVTNTCRHKPDAQDYGEAMQRRAMGVLHGVLGGLGHMRGAYRKEINSLLEPMLPALLVSLNGAISAEMRLDDIHCIGTKLEAFRCLNQVSWVFTSPTPHNPQLDNCPAHCCWVKVVFQGLCDGSVRVAHFRTGVDWVGR
jgi:hypothetical protein